MKSPNVNLIGLTYSIRIVLPCASRMIRHSARPVGAFCYAGGFVKLKDVYCTTN